MGNFTDQAVFGAVDADVGDALDRAVHYAVYGAADQAVEETVYWIVDDAVYWPVYRAVNTAVREPEGEPVRVETLDLLRSMMGGSNRFE